MDLKKAVDMKLAGMTGPEWLRLSDIRVVEGVPRQKFEKVVMKAGEHYKESEDLKFSVGPELLEHWATQFDRMKANGVKVWIAASHNDEGEVNKDPYHSDKTRGVVDRLFVRDDSLVMSCEMIGKDGIAAAARNDVSINAPVSFTDGSGNKYDWPIRNIVCCPDPVITGLGDWVPIAASSKGKSAMSKWDGLRKQLGIETEITDDNAASVIGKAVSGMASELKKFTAKKKDVKASSGEGDEGKDNKDDKGEPKKATPVNPMILSSVTKGRKAELDALVLSGNITPAVRDDLANQYLDPEVLGLALSSETDDGFDSLLETLSKNDPATLGEQTKAQDISASADPRKKNDVPSVVAAAEKMANDAKEQAALAAAS